MKKILVLTLRMVMGILAILIILASYTFAVELHVFPGNRIQTVIEDASDNDVIVVHEGTYVENIDFNGKSITVKSSDPNDPTVVAATIIDGGWAGSVVTFESEEKSTSVLSGFTIKNGSTERRGGGIYCIYSSSPTITNCTISGNSAGDDGGGIYCIYYSSPTITNCTISGNSAGDDGGGIYCCSYSSPTISDCTISGNLAGGNGGGIYRSG